MSLATLGVDLYHLTTLVAHADAGRLDHRVWMGFFCRKLPPARNYLVFCGLGSLLEHAARLGLGEEELEALLAHPLLGPALKARPAVLEALRSVRGFEGELHALREGTLVFAGPGLRTDGSPLLICGVQARLYTPLLQVHTDLLRAKLIETPWLGYINHQSMIASKAARIVDMAGGKPVIEFGARRTHPAAAVDAAYAAWLAGCAATSNVAAYLRYGIPISGTMDHFAIQAAERPGLSRRESERAFFETFARAFPGATTMLVDTYENEQGIRQAAEVGDGRPFAIRLDSNVTPETVAAARSLLDTSGAPHAKIFCSDRLDEYRVRELAGLADGFGVGENITCSPDAATGIGAVAKLSVNGYGQVTMKISRGSHKATLPGPLQAWRFPDHDLIGLASEPPPPAGGRTLLEPVWRGGAALERPGLKESRAYVRAQIESLPPALRALEPAPTPWRLVATDALAREVERLVARAGLA